MELAAIYPSTEAAHDFMSLPSQLYAAAELSRLSQAEPFAHDHFHKAWLLTDAGRPSGRVTIYHNPHLQFRGEKAACLGQYECEADTTFSKALLEEAEKEAKKLGASWLIGPMNGSTWDSYRLNDSPGREDFFLEPYNKAYYTTQLTASGFGKIGHYISSIDEEMSYVNPLALKREQELLTQGFTFRPIDLQRYAEELERLYNFCLHAFSSNFLYTPVSRQDFIQKYQAAAPYIDPEYVILAEDAQGKLAGFVFCLPNLMNATRKQLILKTIARHKGRDYRGLGDILALQVTKAARAGGYDSVIHALMYAEGSSRSLSGRYNGRIFKTYSLYGKYLR